MRHILTITSSVFLLLFVSCGTDSLTPTSKDEKNDKNKVCVTAGYKDVTEISATLSGYANLTSDMTGDIKMGVVCSTDPTPDLKNGIMKTTRELDADNLFSVSITGLQCGTKHYYRAFVYRNDVYTYGEIKMFKTLDINASVTTEGASGITENAATISGSITFSPKANLPVKKGFYISSINSTKPDKWYSATTGFSTQLTNLDYGKTYYYMAAAIIDDMVFSGAVKSFSTESIDVSVSTGNATNVSEHKATISGTIKKSKPYDRLTQEAYIIYSSKNSTLEDLKKKSSYNSYSTIQPDANGVISLSLDNLTQATQYYYVVGFSIGGFEFYGDIKSFTTASISASFSGIRISSINELSAQFNGTVSYHVIEDLPVSVSILYSKNESTADRLQLFGERISLDGIPSNGKISYRIEGLAPSTKYYCALFVKIGESSFSSSILDFTTPTINAVLSISNVEVKSFYDIKVSGHFSYSTVCDLDELGFSLEGELDKGIIYYQYNRSGEYYKSAFFTTDLLSDGSFTAKIPVCTPEESAKVRFIATIHGKKFYSDWYSFMPTTPEVYSTINISPRYYEFGTGYYYDTLVCNGTWPSHSSHPTDGEVQSIIIDGIEIQGVVKVRKVSQDRDYYELNEIRLIAPQNKSFRSIVISKPWYSDPEAITLNVDSGQTGTLKLIPGGGGLGTHGESFPLLRSYWVGDCNRLVFKQSLNATLAIELK